MIAAFRHSSRRIFIAIVLSAMIHAAILWLPHLQLPHEPVNLPPLTARLEPMPLPVGKPAVKPETPIQLSKPGKGSSIKKISSTENSMKEMEKSAATRPFPKHLRLTFTVYRGADVSRVGELRHQLDIVEDMYTLKARKQTTGIASLMNKELLIQSSYGKLNEHGLQPNIFKEEKVTISGKQSLNATFDWITQQLHFSHGGDTALPSDAQDTLSFMYQLSQLFMRREVIPLSISDGTRIEQVQIEIGRAEDISTPMGNLRALHLRKMHVQGEAYFEIWIGLEYRLLPVKFRQIDELDKVIEESVISDIQSANE